MAFDILAAILFVALVGIGYRKGALSQVSWLAAGVAAYFAAHPAAAVCAQIVYGTPSLEDPLLNLGMLLMGGGIVYVVVAITVGLLARFLRKDKNNPSGLDRFGGAVLGLGKAAVVVYVAAFGVMSIGTDLKEADPSDSLRLQGSRVLRVVEEAQPWLLEARKKTELALR